MQIVNGYANIQGSGQLAPEDGMLGTVEMVLQGSYGSGESRSETVVDNGNQTFTLPVLPDQINTEEDLNTVNGIGIEFIPSDPASPSDQQDQFISSPRKQNAKQNGRKKDANPWQMAPRVLVVEDDNVSRLLSAKILQLIGCKADMVSDGPAAVEMMGQNQYDLCLMDINLPSLSGYVV